MQVYITIIVGQLISGAIGYGIGRAQAEQRWNRER